MAPRPRILVIAPDLPFPVRAGGQMRMASLVRALAETAQVHVACTAPEIPETTTAWASDLGLSIESLNPPRIPRSQLWARRVAMVLTASSLAHRRKLQPWFDQVYRRHRPDLVWLETPYLLRYALPWKAEVPLLVDYWGTSDGARRAFLNSRGPYRLWSWLRWRAARGGEVRFAPRVPEIVCVSRLDGSYFEEIAPRSRIWPIPNGILDQAEPDPAALPTEQGGKMVLTGDLSYEPNIDAALHFATEVLPLVRAEMPEAEIHLVGRDPAPPVVALVREPGVRVVGEVPDLSEAIARAALYVLPMRLGSGIRSKLFDVFPLGKAIVTTSVGAEGLELHHGENCLIADSPGDFAGACLGLLRDEMERKRLGDAVRRLATHTYSQANVARLIREAVDAILRG